MFIDTLQSTPDERRLFQQERTILDLTELICSIMEKEGVTRSELAKRLGKTKGYITQLLDGRTNMTLRTISDVFATLNHELSFRSRSQRDVKGEEKKGEIVLDGAVWRQVVMLPTDEYDDSGAEWSTDPHQSLAG